MAPSRLGWDPEGNDEQKFRGVSAPEYSGGTPSDGPSAGAWTYVAMCNYNDEENRALNLRRRRGSTLSKEYATHDRSPSNYKC